MALILNIETSTQVCSVCISKDGVVEAIKESNEEKSHARMLTVFTDQLLKECNYKFDDFDAIAVSKGPGSYTGLRIGVSTAKGLCYAKDLPLIAIGTLQSMAYGIIPEINQKEINTTNTENVVIVPMIDARRMEVYSAFFNLKGEFVREVRAEIIDENSYSDILKKQKMIFFGDGSSKIAEIIKHKSAIFVENRNPSSKDMVSISEQYYQDKNFEDVAYFEPFYLKDFVATIPKKNIFK
ncbi:MAG: tRNA (adenosine(37)-N6)-threonylcarbamoyltransferase complex dimerization subunit type 1 TsaB [Bacteroidales bacterium]|nr:tRNA (adenosine(37)-N6)-threonylcarbamoyltransferase complex dimerization subunit type 1 TsaB [Bacteroidales bacterium]